MIAFFPAMAFALWIQGLMLSIEPARTPDRFLPVAQAIAEVAEQPLPAPWDTSPKSAALMASIGWFESRYTLTATDGQSCGLFQTPCPAALTERAQARRAYAMVRESLEACGDLTLYVSGKCGKAPRTASWREYKALYLLKSGDQAPEVFVLNPHEGQAGDFPERAPKVAIFPFQIENFLSRGDEIFL